MLLRHFGSPYGISAKSGLHNQLSRKMSRGALKCAACAGILQRLFFPAPFRQISQAVEEGMKIIEKVDR